VTETGRAANQLTSCGELEALGDGLFGLLHEESGRKQRLPSRLARGKFILCANSTNFICRSGAVCAVMESCVCEEFAGIGLIGVGGAAKVGRSSPKSAELY
jgi:hypothetical protein